jgi:hypothetical protein
MNILLIIIGALLIVYCYLFAPRYLNDKKVKPPFSALLPDRMRSGVEQNYRIGNTIVFILVFGLTGLILLVIGVLKLTGLLS